MLLSISDRAVYFKYREGLNCKVEGVGSRSTHITGLHLYRMLRSLLFCDVTERRLVVSQPTFRDMALKDGTNSFNRNVGK